MNTKNHGSEGSNTLPGNSKEDFIEREGVTNGKMCMGVKDGVGKTHFKQVFSGNINQQQQQKREEFSNNREFLPQAEWSNGSDTLAIEAKLRATKKKLGYIEPRVCNQHEDTPVKTKLTLYRDATRARDRVWFNLWLGKDYMKTKEIHHNWKKGGYPIVITHKEHVEIHKQDGRWGGKRRGAGRPRLIVGGKQ